MQKNKRIKKISLNEDKISIPSNFENIETTENKESISTSLDKQDILNDISEDKTEKMETITGLNFENPLSDVDSESDFDDTTSPDKVNYNLKQKAEEFNELVKLYYKAEPYNKTDL